MATTRTKRQSPARSAPRAAARPRAKAASRADGDATGEVTPEAQANGVAASPSPEENTPAVAETNGHGEIKPEDKPDEAQLAGYPKGTPLYTYEGPQGKIVFPHIATVAVDPVFFYDIYELPEMYQCFEWMKRAGVPHHVGRQVMAMPLGTRREFFGGWFQGMKDKPPDENMQSGVPGESSRSPKQSGNTGERSGGTSN